MVAATKKANNGKYTAPAPAEAAPEIPSGGLIHIEPIRKTETTFLITGDAPYVQLCFSEKAMGIMRGKHEAGEAAKSNKARKARDFQAEYEAAKHVSTEGWNGIPAMAFKNAMVSACRLCGVPMTRAKQLVFVVPDGFDAASGEPLVRLYGEPEMHVGHVRNATGVADLRSRAMWKKWHAKLTLSYDSVCIDAVNVMSLLYRAGVQVGIGEGRPDSKKSCGMGWGTFTVEVGAAGEGA